jgi:glycolate oxidase FAD binding subunit
MTLQPTTIEELQQAVLSGPKLRVRAGGTKPALSGPIGDSPALDLSRLSRIVDYTPEECTFTALPGTPIAIIAHLLAAERQYLPFDPPLTAAGATLGGTVAAGLNGACRYRYGGIRDFLIGARIVDGCGRLIRSGGKVVKNAAGFLLHHAMVGSCGRFGVLAELSLKVFPAAEARATIRIQTATFSQALDLLALLRRTQFELEAVDFAAPSTLWIRIGGFASALPQRVASLRSALGGPSDVLDDVEDERVWSEAREFAWMPRETTLVRVPLPLSRIPALDAVVAGGGAARRYAVGGNVALLAWPGDVSVLDSALGVLGLTGQVLIGRPGRPFIGNTAPNEIAERVRRVLDPDGRFALLDD